MLLACSVAMRQDGLLEASSVQVVAESK